jgi:ribosome biogenesis GTPase
MYGKIVKAIAGFYYVDVAESGIYKCRAKGVFRKEGKKPLVGDDVCMDVTHEGEHYHGEEENDAEPLEG